MLNHSICITIFSLTACLFSSCESNPAKQPPGNGKLTVSAGQLLKSADSLSEVSLMDRLREFSSGGQDSFFMLRLLELEERETDQAIRSALACYGRLQPESQKLQGFTHYFKGIFFQYAGKFDSADWHYNHALSLFEEQELTVFLALALDKYSGSLLTQGRSDEAIPLKLRAIDLLKASGSTSLMMKTQMHLSNVYSLKGDHEQAALWLEAPLKYYQSAKDTAMQAYIFGLKGSILTAEKNYLAGLDFHRNALALRLHSRDSSGITESFYHVGAILGRLGKWQESLDTLRIAERWLHAYSNKQSMVHIESSLGEALFNLGRIAEADYYLSKCLQNSLDRRQYPAASMAARRLSAIRKEQNQFEEALAFHEQFVQFKDSVFNQEKQRLSQELAVQYQVQQKELKISSLQREQRLAVQRNSLAILMLLLTFGAVFYFNWRKSRIKAKRMAAKNARAEARALNLEQVIEQHKNELEEHKVRLDEYARRLMEKNRQMMQIKEGSAQNRSTPNEIAALNHDDLFQQAILTEADWERFQHYFSKVHPGYISILRQRLPELTPAELRILLLGKLGLSLKETSAILGISLDAVKKGRYRLKKKYKLDTDDFYKIIPYP